MGNYARTVTEQVSATTVEAGAIDDPQADSSFAFATEHLPVPPFFSIIEVVLGLCVATRP